MGPVPQPDEDRDDPAHNNESDIEDAEHPDVIINVEMSDTDSDDGEDDEQGGYIGYQALAQDAGMADEDSDSEEDMQNEGSQEDTDAQNTVGGLPEVGDIHIPEGLVHQIRHPDLPANIPGYMQLPDPPKPERRDMLWNQHRHVDGPLETGHADKIKSVMSSFQLPSSNIPDWASNLSDDQWQSHVVNKLVPQITHQKQEVTELTKLKQEVTESTNQNSEMISSTNQISDAIELTNQNSDVIESGGDS